jgi:glycosyltransferase involved in cell wall biosynthesis
VRIVIAHSQLNTLGGGERVVLELLRHLSRRHEVMLWAGRYRAQDTYAEFETYARRAVAPWQWLVVRPDTDVVISHSLGAHLLALRHPRTICYVHTLRAVYAYGGRRPDLVVRRHLEAAALHHAAAVVTNSGYTAAAVRARYRRTPVLTPGGVDGDLYQLAPGGGRYALYVGRLAPEKGVERLLAWSEGAACELALAGTGEEEYVRYLHARAHPRVRWLGPLRGAALREAYASSRCVVLLSHAEEFGLAALEGMAAARPVVAVPEGGLPELVAHGHTGFLIADAAAYRAAIARLMQDDALCARLGMAGRRVAQRYQWETMAARLERLADQLVERRSGAPAQH